MPPARKTIRRAVPGRRAASRLPFPASRVILADPLRTMPGREITLESASFLESPQRQSIAGASRAEIQQIIERFLTCAFDDLGKAPHLLDGDDMHAILGHLLPARFAKKDPSAAHVGEILRRYFDFLEGREILH